MQKLILFLVLFCFSALSPAQSIDKTNIDAIGRQILQNDALFAGRTPEFTVDGQWKFRKKVNWFSGFNAGQLWHMYHITGDEQFKSRALSASSQLLPFSQIDYTHDMGFIFMPSVVEAFRQTGERQFRKAGLEAADMLARRFNPNGKFIRAWGKLGSKKKAGWMIIDTMMNLDLLFWAAKEAGRPEWYDIAYKHALTTLREAVRSDFSSFHVIEFDPQSGKVKKKFTHQGATDNSTWARGQAWGVYGFARAFYHTGDLRFYAAAKKMAAYMIDRLPADGVPYWDLTMSGADVPRDASAAAVFASGLYLLSDNARARSERELWLSKADFIVKNLLQNYTFKNSTNKPEQGVLIHTVYNYHKNWALDASYPAGDYYFSEALDRYQKHLRQSRPLDGKIGRARVNWNADWYYLQDAMHDVKQLDKSAANWQLIDLPHTWNRFDATDNEPGYRRSASWYGKALLTPQLAPGERVVLEFEAANMIADVYVNGQRAGGHVGGFLDFEVDITPYLVKQGVNEIRVRVDNSYQPWLIPSQKSDFFIYGGLTRDVWLKKLPSAALRYVQIRTPQVDAARATVTIQTELDLPEKAAASEVQVQVLDPAGNIIARKQAVINGSDANVELQIDQPKLWSTEHPQLYRARIQLSLNGKRIDTVSRKFGLRWFEFKEHGAFYLNGERLLLRGTHRHEEHAGYGAAMPDALHRQDMQMIKEMGANFVRLAHYPQDLEIYQACDSLGLLVWDELPWCRGGMGGQKWKENTRRLFIEQVRQNFNHPSIIIWSLGNELYWLPDFENGAQDDSLRVFLIELNDLSHHLDPGRMTALRKYYAGADIVDVFSPSIWAGWYSGVYTNYAKAIENARKKYKRFFHAEYGGASHLGRHDETPVDGSGVSNPDGWEEDATQVKVKNVARSGDWSENYIVDLFDWHLAVSEQSDWLSGNAQWAFKDFGTPLRPENAIPFINQKGLLDRAGNPKDAWYVFRSYWTSDPKFCYIESHTWTERQGPPNKVRNVCVFSNCAQVELLLNGQSQGVKQRIVGKFPAAGLNWDINFTDGQNTLLALGLDKEGHTIATDTLALVYYYEQFGKADHITLSKKRLSNGNWLIEARLVDGNGRRVLDYNKRIYFAVDGAGRLLRFYGTSTRSDVIEMANGYAAVELKAVPGERTVVEARNQDFKGSYLVIGTGN